MFEEKKSTMALNKRFTRNHFLNNNYLKKKKNQNACD